MSDYPNIESPNSSTQFLQINVPGSSTVSPETSGVFQPNSRLQRHLIHQINGRETKIHSSELSTDRPKEVKEHVKDAQNYFKQDSDSVKGDNEDSMKVDEKFNKEDNPYDIFFKPVVFVKFFLMHILYFFCLGPLIVVITPITGYNVLYNQRFVGFNGGTLVQTIQCFGIIAFLVAYYVLRINGLHAIEVFMVVIAVIIKIITISSKYAYLRDSDLEMLYKRKLLMMRQVSLI